jgi:hypothetical protein
MAGNVGRGWRGSLDERSRVGDWQSASWEQHDAAMPSGTKTELIRRDEGHEGRLTRTLSSRKSSTPQFAGLQALPSKLGGSPAELQSAGWPFVEQRSPGCGAAILLALPVLQLSPFLTFPDILARQDQRLVSAPASYLSPPQSTRSSPLAIHSFAYPLLCAAEDRQKPTLLSTILVEKRSSKSPTLRQETKAVAFTRATTSITNLPASTGQPRPIQTPTRTRTRGLCLCLQFQASTC